MNFVKILLILLVIFQFSLAFGQADDAKTNELIVSDEDQIILFTVAILIVIGIFIFMARNNIRKKKTTYDKSEFSSKKDRDYEKYHSEWSDDYEDLGKKASEYEEEFRKAVNESSLPNYYEVLGVDKNATQSEIKQKFRRLAKEIHPDKTKDEHSQNKMAEINKAYEILSDQERREKYDKYLNVS